MKKLIYLLALPLVMCNNLPKEDPNSFEGCITYKTSIHYNDLDYLQGLRFYFDDLYGDTTQLCFAHNGDFKRLYPISGAQGNEYSLYHSSTNLYYAKWKSIDTAYYSNCKANSINLISRVKGPDKVILGKNCQSVIITSFEPIGKDTIVQELYYGDEPYINPEFYKNYNDFFTYDNFKEFKSPYLMAILNFGPYTITHEAVSIDNGELAEDFFALPNETPLKKE